MIKIRLFIKTCVIGWESGGVTICQARLTLNRPGSRLYNTVQAPTSLSCPPEICALGISFLGSPPLKALLPLNTLWLLLTHVNRKQIRHLCYLGVIPSAGMIINACKCWGSRGPIDGDAFTRYCLVPRLKFHVFHEQRLSEMAQYWEFLS